MQALVNLPAHGAGGNMPMFPRAGLRTEHTHTTTSRNVKTMCDMMGEAAHTVAWQWGTRGSWTEAGWQCRAARATVCVARAAVRLDLSVRACPLLSVGKLVSATVGMLRSGEFTIHNVNADTCQDTLFELIAMC